MNTATKTADVQLGLLLMRQTAASQFWYLMSQKPRRRSEVEAAVAGGRSEIEDLVTTWVNDSERVLTPRGWQLLDSLLTLGAVAAGFALVAVAGGLMLPSWWPAAAFAAWIAIELALRAMAEAFPRSTLLWIAMVGFGILAVMVEMSTGSATFTAWQIAALVLGVIPWFVFGTRLILSVGGAYFASDASTLDMFWRKAGLDAETRSDMAREIAPLASHLEAEEIEGLGVNWPRERTGRSQPKSWRAVLQAAGAGLLLASLMMAGEHFSSGSRVVDMGGDIVRSSAIVAAVVLALAGLPGLGGKRSTAVGMLSVAAFLVLVSFTLVQAGSVVVGSWSVMATVATGLVGAALTAIGVRRYSDV